MGIETCDHTNLDFELTKEDLLIVKIQRSIKHIIKREGYQTYSVKIKVFSPDGGNYLGILAEVDIKGKTVDGNKETNIFMKIILPNENMSILSLTDVYRKELFYYTDLIKVFTELQDEVGLPAEERFKFVNSFDESQSEAIIMENMRKKGFTTLHRMEFITLEFAELAIKQLAKYHALSFVLEDRRPKYFESKIKTVKQPFSYDDDWKSFMGNMHQVTLNYLEGETKKRVEKFMSESYTKYPQYLSENEGYKSCLSHGDFRPNNILIKKSGNEILELIPIDFQLMYYGCPILDFFYFIFVSTDQKFRRAHLTHLKDIYYETMTTFLNRFNLEVDAVFPRKQFETSYKERMDYGLIISLLLTPLLMVKDDEVPDLTQPASAVTFSTDDTCKERILEIIEDFIEWGYL